MRTLSDGTWYAISFQPKIIVSAVCPSNCQVLERRSQRFMWNEPHLVPTARFARNRTLTRCSWFAKAMRCHCRLEWRIRRNDQKEVVSTHIRFIKIQPPEETEKMSTVKWGFHCQFHILSFCYRRSLGLCWYRSCTIASFHRQRRRLYPPIALRLCVTSDPRTIDSEHQLAKSTNPGGDSLDPPSIPCLVLTHGGAPPLATAAQALWKCRRARKNMRICF